jgi:hypothetical protein
MLGGGMGVAVTVAVGDGTGDAVRVVDCLQATKNMQSPRKIHALKNIFI